MEGGPGFFSPAFVAAGSRELLSGIGGSASLRLFGRKMGILKRVEQGVFLWEMSERLAQGSSLSWEVLC